MFWVVNVIVASTNPSLIIHLRLLTCRRLWFSSAPASCRIASHQPVALPPPPTFTSPVDSWLLCYRVLRHPPGLFHPMVHVVFLSPTPVDCPFTPPPTHGYAATAHRPDNAPTMIVPLTCYRQCRRQRVGRRRRRPSNNDALPPAPHGCQCCTPTAPTRRHRRHPANARHRRFAHRKASEDVQRQPPPLFDCCVYVFLFAPAASQSANVAAIDRPRHH